jgi:hypothetical protein
MAKNWTEKEEQYLKDNFEEKSNVKLAEKFGVTAKSIESKLGRLKLRRAKPAKPKKASKAVKTAKQAVSKPKVKKQRPTRNVIHDNIRCRYCLTVDGYTEEEKTCRHCGAKLFKGDVL